MPTNASDSASRLCRTDELHVSQFDLQDRAAICQILHVVRPHIFQQHLKALLLLLVFHAKEINLESPICQTTTYGLASIHSRWSFTFDVMHLCCRWHTAVPAGGVPVAEVSVAQRAACRCIGTRCGSLCVHAGRRQGPDGLRKAAHLLQTPPQQATCCRVHQGTIFSLKRLLGILGQLVTGTRQRD